MKNILAMLGVVIHGIEDKCPQRSR